jgi:serine/threonine protein kinase
MGTVWMAQQTEPVKRVVALKLIKAGMDSKQVIARFEAERQALALMDHPNIAKVLDGGTTGEPSGVSRRVEDDGEGAGAIVDDEPRITISDVTKAEGRRGHTTTLFTFTVTLSAALRSVGDDVVSCRGRRRKDERRRLRR